MVIVGWLTGWTHLVLVKNIVASTWLVGWLDGRSVGWIGWLAGYLAGRLLVGWLVGWLAGWWAGRLLVGWMVGWHVVGWSVGLERRIQVTCQPGLTVLSRVVCLSWCKP